MAKPKSAKVKRNRPKKRKGQQYLLTQILPHGVNRKPSCDDEVTPGMIADIFGISDQTVRHWIKTRGMPTHRITLGIYPRYYLSLSAAIRWMEKQGIIKREA